MAQIRPFRAVRPKKELAQQVASQPYDVLNSEEAREEAGDNPHSFLRITKAEIDLPPATHTHDSQVYAKAKQNLDSFISAGVLEQDEFPFYYIYQLVMPGDENRPERKQTGLVCLSSIEDYENGIIKKHEFTRPEKEKDRIDHMLATRAQTGNVFLAYNNVKELDSLIEHWTQNQSPSFDFTAGDGIRHIVWTVNHPAVIASITALFAAKVPYTYIADGHHRAASAARVSQNLSGHKEAQYFLTTIFPASQLAIMDYNRVVKDLNGHSYGDFLEKLRRDFVISPQPKAYAPEAQHRFGMYLDGQWHRLEAKAGTYTEDPIGVLDVSILSANILDKILGIKDQRTDKRIDFVGGIRGLGELEKRVNSGEMEVAFSLHPVSIRQLFDIADSGNVMPPKSTWFEPKLRDGLLTHLIE